MVDPKTYKAIPEPPHSPLRNNYISAFEESISISKEFMAALQNVTDKMSGIYLDYPAIVSHNDLTGIFEARLGKDRLADKMVKEYTMYKKTADGFSTQYIPPSEYVDAWASEYKMHQIKIKDGDGELVATVYGASMVEVHAYATEWIEIQPGYMADIIMLNHEGNVNPQFEASLNKLKNLTEGQLIGWQTTPFDSAALFLIALLELRDKRQAYMNGLEVRLKANLLSLLGMNIPSKEDISNLRIEAETTLNYKFQVPEDDPREWGTKSNFFLKEPGFIIYGTAARRESLGVSAMDRLLDKESLIYNVIQKVIGIPNTELKHTPRLGFHINGISFDMFFNLYAKALHEMDDQKFWETMYSYRFFARAEHESGIDYTAIYLAPCDPYTGAPKNAGQLAAYLPIDKEEAISKFKQHFPHILPADSNVPASGEFIPDKELQGWISRTDKSNFQYIVRVNQIWDWNPVDFSLPVYDYQHTQLWRPVTAGGVREAFAKNSKDDISVWWGTTNQGSAWNNAFPGSYKVTTQPGSNSRIITFIEVFAVPNQVISSIKTLFTSIPEKTLEIWEEGMGKWRHFVDNYHHPRSETLKDIPSILMDWYNPSKSNMTIYGARFHKYLSNGWDLLLLPPTNPLRDNGMPKNLHQATWHKMNGLKALIDYFNSTAWLTPTHTHWSGIASTQKSQKYGVSGVYMDDSILEMENYLQTINLRGIVPIYNTSVDGIDDVVNVIRQLKKSKALDGMAETPVFDVQDFTILFKDDKKIEYNSPIIQQPHHSAIKDIPYLNPILKYKRTDVGVGAGIQRWLKKYDHGTGAVSRIYSKKASRRAVGLQLGSSGILTTREFYRYPVYTIGISGRRFGRITNFSDSTAIRPIAVQAGRPYEHTGTGLVSMPTMAGGLATFATIYAIYQYSQRNG